MRKSNRVPLLDRRKYVHIPPAQQKMFSVHCALSGPLKAVNSTPIALVWGIFVRVDWDTATLHYKFHVPQACCVGMHSREKRTTRHLLQCILVQRFDDCPNCLWWFRELKRTIVGFCTTYYLLLNSLRDILHVRGECIKCQHSICGVCTLKG